MTFARHEVLSSYYKDNFPESFDPAIDREYLYTGKQRLTDKTEKDGVDVGQLLLSPTRTYLPVLARVLTTCRDKINGIIHCSGGGQTKVMHFYNHLHVVKNKLLDLPPVFRLIQEQSNADWKEMYKVFNMGHRLEFYVEDETTANTIISIARDFNIEADVIGFCEASEQKKLSIHSALGDFYY